LQLGHASHIIAHARRPASRLTRDPDGSRGGTMSVAKVTEISSTSTKSFEDAITGGLARAQKTIRNIKSAWIKEQQVRLDKGQIVEYQVNLLLTFVLDD
jgi:flavin-binding protein dodecin